MSFLPSPATPTATIPKTKMGKKKSDIYSCFQILPMKNKANKSIFMCKFCDRQYLQNATKMESHIVTQCQKVPPEVRISYAKVPGGGGGNRLTPGGGGGSGNIRSATMGMTSSPANSDSTNSNSDSRPETPVNLSQFAAANRARMTQQHHHHHHQAMNNNNSSSSRGSATSNNNIGGGGSSGLVVKRAVGALMAQVPRGSQQQLRQQMDSKYLGNADVYQQQRANFNSMQNNKRPRLGVDGMGNHNQQNSSKGRNHMITNNHVTLTSASNNNYLYQQSRQQLGNNMNKRGAAVSTMSGSHFGSNNNRNHIILKNTIKNNNNNSSGNSNTARLTAKNINAAAASANVDHPPPRMDHQEMVDIWRLLARGIYATGCPVSLFENEYLTEAFKKLRPALSLPTTYALSNTLLREEYLRVKQDIIHNQINECNFVTLQCESHPGNSSEEQILCFFVTTPSPVLYRLLPLKPDEISLPSMKKGKVSEIISSTIDDIGSTKVLVFISDLKKSSLCEIKSSWESLRSSYPGLITFGCIFQGLNSLLDTFLEEEPPIRDICQKGKFIVDRTKGSSILKRRFQELQKKLKLRGVPAFKFSNKSKYSSLAKSLDLLISQKAAFQQLITNCEHEEEAQEAFLVHEKTSLLDGAEGLSGLNLSYEELVEVTKDEKFWNGIESVRNIIVPLSNWIKIMEPESSPSISQLPLIFHELKSAFEDNLKNLPQETDTDSLIQLLNHTKRLCVNELHYAACLLNPKLKSQGILTEDEEEEGSEFIHYFCETREFDAPRALQQLADYRKNVDFFAKPSVLELAKTLDPIAWWQNLRPGTALGSVAVLLLAVSPSLCTFDPKALLGSVPLSSIQGEGESFNSDKLEKLAFLKHHLEKSKKFPVEQTTPKSSSSEGLSGKNNKEWSPQPQSLDEQEPMDVTQFLSQNTQPDEYSESEAEDDEEMPLVKDTILSAAIMGNSPEVINNNNIDKEEVIKDEIEDEDEPVVKTSSSTNDNGVVENNNNENDNDNDDDDSSSSDSDGSSSGNSSSSSSSTKTNSSETSKPPNLV